MWTRTVGAVLDPVGHFKITSAILQQVQRAKTKQTVEPLGVGSAVAGKISAGRVREKAVAVFHGWLLFTADAACARHCSVIGEVAAREGGIAFLGLDVLFKKLRRPVRPDQRKSARASGCALPGAAPASLECQPQAKAGAICPSKRNFRRRSSTHPKAL